MPAEEYYRVVAKEFVLDPDTQRYVENPQSPFRRWERGQFNATHKSCPDKWVAKWKSGSTVEKDFTDDDLKDPELGIYTRDALRAFLRLANSGQVIGVLSDLELVAIGELDGTCAFKDKIEACNYLLGVTKETPIEECTITQEKLDLSYIAVFKGISLGIRLPEAKGGGYQVTVIDPGDILPAREFAEHIGFRIPVTSEAPDESGSSGLDEPEGFYEPDPS